MKTLGRIAYWLFALALVSAILVSLDYVLSRAILISLIFCLCALTLERFMPTARKPIDKLYLSLAVLTSAILLILVLHFFLWVRLSPEGYIENRAQVAPTIVNPAFLGLILTALSIGDYFWTQWLGKRFKEKDRSVSFFSDRKTVTLRLADIAYVESNDTEVRLFTTGGESFRNKTGISQWENLLGADFLRIHRSYLVNVRMASLTAPDTVSVCGTQLPVSRKYREIAQATLSQPSADSDPE